LFYYTISDGLGASPPFSSPKSPRHIEDATPASPGYLLLTPTIYLVKVMISSYYYRRVRTQGFPQRCSNTELAHGCRHRRLKSLFWSRNTKRCLPVMFGDALDEMPPRRWARRRHDLYIPPLRHVRDDLDLHDCALLVIIGPGRIAGSSLFHAAAPTPSLAAIYSRPQKNQLLFTQSSRPDCRSIRRLYQQHRQQQISRSAPGCAPRHRQPEFYRFFSARRPS